MKKQACILNLTLFITLLVLPLALVAEEMAAQPEKKAEKVADAGKEQWTAARKKALADPVVKEAMDAAKKAQVEANKLVLVKMRDIDPALAPMIDKEEAKMKPKEPKPAADKKNAKPAAPAGPEASDKPAGKKPAKAKDAAKENAEPAPAPKPETAS